MIRWLVVHGSSTRAALSDELGLSYTSSSRAAQRLVSLGFAVEESADTVDRLGRPQRELSIDPNAAHVVGIVIKDRAIYAVGCDLQGRIVTRATASVPGRGKSFDKVVERIAGLARQIADELPTFDAIGVSIGGVVTESRWVKRSAFLDWAPDADLAGQLGLAFDKVPVTVANDVAALCHDYILFGDGRLAPNFGLITVGRGIGFGSADLGRLPERIDDGHLMTHSPIGGNRTCHLGHTGCAAAYLERQSAVVEVSGKPQQSSFTAIRNALTTGSIPRLGRLNNPDDAAQLLNEASVALGHLVATYAGALQTRKMILGGEDVSALTPPDSPFWNILTDRTSTSLGRDFDPQIDVSILDTDPRDWARGAAAVAVHELLASEA